MKFVIPLAIAALIGLGIWYYISTKEDPNSSKAIPTKPSKLTEPDPKTLVPEIPDATKVQSDLTSMFDSLGTTLGGIKDEATLTAAAPNITEMQTKATGLKAILDKLPAVGKSSIIAFIKSKLGGLKEMIAKLTMIPGLGDKLKPVNGLFDTLEGYTK